jgi:hypothetical protein
VRQREIKCVLGCWAWVCLAKYMGVLLAASASVTSWEGGLLEGLEGLSFWLLN